MIKKRLLRLVPEANKYIFANVFFQWIGLVNNIAMIYTIANMLDCLIQNKSVDIFINTFILMLCVFFRVVCVKLANSASYHASKSVKVLLRGLLYKKLLKLGFSYTEHVSTGEVVQLAGEGVEQLESYFGQYMPQFFYAFLAPITLFFVIRRISNQVAIILLICVPLIPVSIVLVQKIAKILLKDYWSQYANLADHFLESLQGLVTLKIYQADQNYHEKMNKDAEAFRIITMKVLTMQLNSIIVMDTIAYGGAALGILLAIRAFVNQEIPFIGCFMIILLSADFFLPMRQLGSYFHVAMNGMSASDKIFAILDLPEEKEKQGIPTSSTIRIEELSFGYSKDKEILHNISMNIKEGSFVAIVGESGCGKSTIASLLTRRNRGYSGTLEIGDIPLSEVNQEVLLQKITLISHNSYIFKGSLKENLLMGNKDASEEELYSVLKMVNLFDFVNVQGGLDMPILEGGSNLSGGQRQRLALARALLHDSSIYVFDEATSNIDVESENDIMKLILSLQNKTVILISHRLANVVKANQIFVMKNGKVVQTGDHEHLVNQEGVYKSLWEEQVSLENMLKEGVEHV